MPEVGLADGVALACGDLSPLVPGADIVLSSPHAITTATKANSANGRNLSFPDIVNLKPGLSLAMQL